MPAAVIIQDSFLACAYELPKEISRKVFKALRALAANPKSGGLHLEKLGGRSKGLWSARVDDNYRIVFDWSSSGVPVVIYVAKHDDAYAFSDSGSVVNLGLGVGSVPGNTGAQIGSIPPVAGSKAIAEIALPPKQPLRISAEIDELEPLVNTRKYLPLARVLLNSSLDRIVYSFSDIERIIGFSLPASARKFPAWRANESSGNHVQARAWMAIGWRVETLNLIRESVTFRR
jgi:plasmid maintenance system killer protein